MFSMLVRVRRVQQLLRGLHGPLAAKPQSTADLLLRSALLAPNQRWLAPARLEWAAMRWRAPVSEGAGLVCGHPLGVS